MAGGAAAGIMIAQNLGILQKGLEAAPEAWTPLEARGLVLGTRGTSGFEVASGPTRPFLEGKVDGAAITIHVRSDFVHSARTEIAAKTVDGPDVVVGVHPSPGGLLGYLRSWIGQDIEVGEPAWDEAYLVTGKPEEAAKALLVPSVRDLVAMLGPKLAGFTYGKEQVLVVLGGVETDTATLGTAIDLAVAAATFRGAAL